ncbi:MAG: 3-methyl-2-oxobutanoate hydroxymethyltransferase [Anaerolineae bacterium]|jgi:3-methyl-2-oxobutanoate hydroxymethyltransferase|nr:3-methyl-2-oxobutanoate hydroxymethyltransferase [Anaerolineae bacterium]
MRLTIRDIQKLKEQGEAIVVITAYDAMSARLSEIAQIPMILVGDSLGMVVQGHDSTIPVTLDQMIYHAEIVVRVTQKPLIIGDLPFMSYSISPEQALSNAARMMQESGVSCVKVEGGEFMAPTIQRIVQAGIPVMAHIGLTPQSVNQFGGFRVQGREIESARKLLQDAIAIEQAGAFAVVLELVPAPLAQVITERLNIPTIGIGAGAGCSGQVQVFHDLLTLAADFLPKHTKRYANLSDSIADALQHYVQEVKAGVFPSETNSFSMNQTLVDQLRREFLQD